MDKGVPKTLRRQDITFEDKDQALRDDVRTLGTLVGDLIREVREQTGLARPWGPVVALGHSGAYRTLLDWLDADVVDHMLLIDGLYGHEEPFLRWLDAPAVPLHRLTLVGLDTLSYSELATAQHPLVTNLDWVPETIADIPAAARTARLLNIRSQFDHMALITAGSALPVLLALSGLPALSPDRQK